MAAHKSKPKLLVIVGPTASGKSELALKLAQKYNGEIIAADSRTVYKGMDIGTAKPSASDQQNIKHWGLDLIEPDKQFSAKQFKDYALVLIKDIRRRNKLPILVGGTGLYIDSIIFDYSFPPAQKRNPLNSRHSLEAAKDRLKEPAGTIILGLDPGKEVLRARIARRVDQMLSPDFEQEVQNLKDKYPRDVEAFKAPGYQSMLEYLEGKITLEEVRKNFIHEHLKLAKKQRTWFKRSKFILWYEDIDSAQASIRKELNT